MEGDMKRRGKALGMALLLIMMTVFSVVSDAAMVKADELLIKLHYHRADDNYDGWDVWMWEEGADGAAYELTEEDGDHVATMEVTPGTTSVGFIVRTADWTKDVDEDQFIDISEMVSGTVDIYVESGVEGYTKEYGDDAVTGTKLSGAKYDGEGAVTVQMTGAIDGDLMQAFSIKSTDGVAAAIKEVTEDDDFVYQVVLEEPLDAYKSYQITYE